MSIVDRVNLTSSCKDCDIIEKYPKAGDIFEDENGKFQYMFNGVKIYYDSYHSPWMNDIIKNLNGHHEPQEEVCFYHLLKTLDDNANMIELGSNWSYYSIWFNKQIKNPFNICIEPVLDNLIKGEKNSKINNCKNIKFELGCISDTYIENFTFKNWNGDLIGLTQYNLNFLLKKYNLFFDIVHSDIQGFEYNMIIGSQNVIEKIGYFVVSTHGDTHERCKELLVQNNFLILISHSISESFSEDGLIIAVNKLHIEKYESKINESLVEYFSKIKISRR